MLSRAFIQRIHKTAFGRFINQPFFKVRAAKTFVASGGIIGAITGPVVFAQKWRNGKTFDEIEGYKKNSGTPPFRVYFIGYLCGGLTGIAIGSIIQCMAPFAIAIIVGEISLYTIPLIGIGIYLDRTINSNSNNSNSNSIQNPTSKN